jgi:hypothetical protein
MVELTSARLRLAPTPASARQPVAVVSVMVKLLAGLSEPKSGVLASITKRYPSFNLIATHLQLHLAITKMISTPPL